MAADSIPFVVRETIKSEFDPPPQFQIDVLCNALRKAGNLPLPPELADENGTLAFAVDPKYLYSPRAPPAPEPLASEPGRLDKLYAQDFRRLELELEARTARVPAFVSDGTVATLSFVSVSAEGRPTFEAGLENHWIVPAK